ncbi:MAG TPA: hypothetical protein VFW71_00805 [Actinomycetota bacterium]|nr:hypothetical protein [Actinomycetota bacterium]
MRSHAMLILCDACRKEIPDEAAKEVVFQVDGVRYRLELCSSCLDGQMGLHPDHRWIPGFRKRTALAFVLHSADELPGRLAGTAGLPATVGTAAAQ